ncbi:MAG: M23 family metallopeptidase [Candidatus Aminicenantes bacterium]|nr:M23 family metallopeptidase [Candidatus Aminicenantes bacterium]
MAKKFCSVIIVPHTKTNVKTISFTKKTLKAAVIGSAILALLLIVFLVDYVSMGLLRQKYKTMSRELTEQSEKLASYEKSIAELKATIDDFDIYAKKLNVMLGLKSPDVIADKAGLGGGEPTAEGSGPQLSVPAAPGSSLGQLRSLNQKADGVSSNLNQLVGLSEAKTALMASTPAIMPTRGWLNSPYGHRTDPFTGIWTMHWGVDIATNPGNPIVATGDGIVVRVQSDKYLGKNVVLSHGFGITTVYGHMSAFNVRMGQKVKRGDVIGFIGMTGKAVGPHVHYEVRIDGRSVNPYNYILEE